MTDKRTKAELLEALRIAEASKAPVTIQNCNIGDFTTVHLDAVVALAKAAEANAIAISDIARKATVQIATGISINQGNTND